MHQQYLGGSQLDSRALDASYYILHVTTINCTCHIISASVCPTCKCNTSIYTLNRNCLLHGAPPKHTENNNIYYIEM